ncbi:ABC transporter permease [Peptostreptococcus faecalis]|uniref:ABC transporter permease n=1 Tax=Peptostreptococcus faecalis TaxID=2045015 RepID=UPI000C7E157A|nr:ABC transporter permease [Peptostreptococcus faecalis]
MHSFNIFVVEVRKLIKNRYHNISIYISLFLWPALILASTYFTYSSFELKHIYRFGINGKKELMIFLCIGAMGLNVFFSMMQSAFHMSEERKNGTLEIIFLSPCNKTLLMIARAFSALVENIWIILLCTVYIIYLKGSFDTLTFFKSIGAIMIILLSAGIWGAFMNAIFLFSKDASFLFNLIDLPMDLFAGVRFPVQALPTALQVISAIYPLKYALDVFRSIFLGISFNIKELLYFVIILLMMLVLTVVIVKFAEHNNKKVGSFNFY